MRPLGSTVQRVLRALGIDQEVARASAIDAWLPAASEVIGSDAERTRAVRVEGTTLVVAVPTAQWAVEIRLRERELVARLGAAAPGSGITRIRSVADAPHDDGDRRARGGDR